MVLFSRKKPNIKVQTTKKDGFSGWLKCTHCSELIHLKELDQSQNCCPKCDYHYRVAVRERIASLADEKSFKEKFNEITALDPLNFEDTETYADRLDKAKEKTKETEAVVCGTCTVSGIPVALAVMNFSFMGGSMGSVVGERITRLIEFAIKKKMPLVIVTSSGGARMQESVFSLMQMAKTSAAIARFHEEGLPYISILTNPTTGGVTASFATLADVILAEPKALIAFAGPRVVEQTIGQKLPPGAQQSDFILEHGLIDCIVTRRELKAKLSSFLRYIIPKKEEKGTASSTLEELMNIAESGPGKKKTVVK